MKGASIASADPLFISHAGTTLQKHGFESEVYESSVSFDRGGKRLLIYSQGTLQDVALEYFLEESEPDPRLRDLPWGYLCDCRWEGLFCETMNVLASEHTFLIIDNNGRVLTPGNLKPEDVCL